MSDLKERLVKYVEECKKLAYEVFPETTTSEILRTTPYGAKLSLNKGENGRIQIGVFAGLEPDIPTMGYGSLCDGSTTRFEHVLFLDYDWINEWMVIEELAYLVDKYSLSNFYLFSTRRIEYPQGGPYDRWYGSYQAVCCTKLPFKKIIEIIEQTHCDFNYKYVPFFSRYKEWFLRFVSKAEVEPPRFLRLVPHNPVNMDRLVSRKHVLFLEKWFGCPHLPYTNLDDSKELDVSPYYTGKK